MTTPTPSPSEEMRLAEEQAWQRHLATMPEGARRNVMESAARGESETRKAHSSAYLAALASTQAAEVERLTRERDDAMRRFETLLAQEHALSDSYVRIRQMVGAMNPPALTPEALFPYVEASVAHALKAKQIDVEAVMRLADKVASRFHDFVCPGSTIQDGAAWEAAREALRASLLGDGGTL